MDTKHLTSAHVRTLGYCVTHLRKFCDKHGFEVRKFMREGASVTILNDNTVKVSCGEVEVVVDDAQLLKLVRSI